MPPIGEETTQNVNLNVTGAEKVVGATMFLQDFSSALQQLISNPLGGAYAMNRIAHGFQTAFIDPLKKTKDLTVAQQVAFDKMVQSGSRIATISGAVGGLILSMTELIRKSKIASTELGQFMSLNQLPGGAKDLYDAQLIMQEKFIDKSLKYNEEYGQEYAAIYKQLRRKILADITPPGMSPEEVKKITEGAEPQIDLLIEQLTTLQKATGLSVAGFTRMRDSFKLLGLDLPKIIDLYKLLTTEYLAGTEFEGFTGVELGETLQGSMRAFSEAGTLAPTALGQILTVMENYAPYAGVEEIQKLLSIIPSFQNDFQKGTTARMLVPGMSLKDISGPKGGANILNALVKEVHQMIGAGKTPENILELWGKNAGGVAKLERLGITGGTIQALNQMTELEDVTTRVVEKMNKMNLNPGVLKDTEDMKNIIEESGKGLKDSENAITMTIKLVEWLGVHLQKALKAAGLDVPMYAIQYGVLGALGVGAILKGRQAIRFLKSITNLVPPPKGPTPGFTPWGDPLPETVIPPAEGMGAPKGGSLRKFFKKGGGGRSTLLLLLLPLIDELWKNFQSEMPAYDISTGKMVSPEEKAEMTAKFDKFSNEKLQYGVPGEGAEEFFLNLPHMLFPKQNWRFDKGEPLPELDFSTQSKGVISSETAAKIQEMARMQASFGLGPQAPPPPKEEPKEGVAGDVGTLRIIISNDAGNELANATLNEARNQGGLRVIMSAVSEA